MLFIQAALCESTGSLEILVFHTLSAGNIGQFGAPGTVVVTTGVGDGDGEGVIVAVGDADVVAEPAADADAAAGFAAGAPFEPGADVWVSAATAAGRAGLGAAAGVPAVAQPVAAAVTATTAAAAPARLAPFTKCPVSEVTVASWHGRTPGTRYLGEIATAHAASAGRPDAAKRGRQAGRSALQWAVMAARSLSELIAPDWAAALAPVESTITELGTFLRAEIAAGRGYLPAGDNILRAFRQPLADVRVLIVGQDPYPTPGNPVGLSFSVAPDVRRLPGSLINIFKEYTADLGHPRPSTGDLTPWSERGVMLLNRVLTVQPGQPGSHRGKGWEQVTEQAIRALAARGGPLVAILWGNDARNLAPLLGGAPSIQSAHPSPMSADRGFFGSRPFSRADSLLVQQGAEPLDWKLP
jgi:uracil-DNA glycosylase